MTDVDTNEVEISINQSTSQMNIPRRSSATALDIYSEIRNTKEEELLKVIDEQRTKIAELENEVSMLRSIVEKSTETGERDGKKRKRTDGSIDDHTIQERQNLKMQVESLTKKLEVREHELHEVREQLAESEWNEKSTPKDNTSELCEKIEKQLTKK